jgi:hypothetical protein
MDEEQIDEPQVRVSINLSALQGTFFVQLQRLLDILAVSLAGLERVDDVAYAGFSPFFTLAPAQNERLTRSSAVAEAQRWYLCTVVRDAIEFTHAFLEECRLVCAFFSLIARGTPIMGADYHRIVGAEAQKFHGLGLPDKLKRLREDFSVASELETHVLSINTMRNCLVHRLGIVADRDVDANGELAILWRSIDLVAQSPDGTHEIVLNKDTIIEAGWTVIVRVTDKRKVFRKGERIELSYEEITHTFSSLMSFATTLGQSIEGYGKRIGIRLPDPQSQTA